jgi:membrane protein
MALTNPKILEAGGTEVSTAAGGARRYRKPLTAFRWCDIKALLSQSVVEWNMHKGPRLGAALAFYTLLSLTPLLLIAVGTAGLVFGREAAQSQIVWQYRTWWVPGAHRLLRPY